MSTIQDRKYVELEQRRFKPTDLGFIVNDKLVLHFPKVVDIQFTAGVEEKLDEVEEGKQDWVAVLREFYDPFSEDLVRANTEMEKVAPVETDFDCPTCGKKLVLRRGRFGEFFSCSDYPECKTAMNVGPNGEPMEKVEKVAVVVEGIEQGATRECEKCGKPMVVRTSRRGPFWGCTGYPKCRNTIAIEGTVVGGPEVLPPAVTDHMCPNCGKPMAERRGRFGPFLGCTGYPECKTLVNLDKDGKPREAAVTVAKQESAAKGAAKAAPAKPAKSTKATTAKAKSSKSKIGKSKSTKIKSAGAGAKKAARDLAEVS